MGNHGESPYFADGQVLSSAEHMNPLQLYVQGLADGLRGPSMPFSGVQVQQDPHQSIVDQASYPLTYHGYLVHQHDTFSYAYYIIGGGTAEIQIDGKTVPGSSGTGNGDHIGTDVDISSLNLEVGELYSVSMPGDATYRVYLLAETYNPSMPALPSMVNDTTPTAEEWQALSEYADLLDARLSPPRACATTAWNRNPQVLGTLHHQCRYLAYSIRMQMPYWGTADEPDIPNPIGGWPGNKKSITVHLYINGVEALQLRLSGTDENYYPEGRVVDTYWQITRYGIPSEEHTFTGTLDLNTYPIGAQPAFGADYIYLQVQDTEALEYDTSAVSNTIYLYEIDLAGPLAIPDWEDFVDWQHGYFVYGNTASPHVETVVHNLELLNSLIKYANYPGPLKMTPFIAGGEGLYSIRRWRWLRYVTSLWWVDEDDDGNAETLISLPGQINYTYRGQHKTVDLRGDAGALGQWQVQDLDEVPGLYVGTDYSLHDVDYAYEIAEFIPPV